MGWSECEGYWKAMGRAVSNAYKKEGIRPSGIIRLAELGHMYRYGVYPDYLPDSCEVVRGFEIPIRTSLGREVVIKGTFSCPCTRAKPPEKIEYKGFSIFVHKKRRKYGIFYNISIEGAEGRWANIGGYDKEFLLNKIKSEINRNGLTDVYGNVMKPKGG